MSRLLAKAVIVFALLCGPAAAQAPGVAGAKAFWDQQKALAEAFDARFADAYAADAQIIGVRNYPAPRPPREMRMTGDAWAKLARVGMPLAKMQGDVSTYRDEAFAPAEGDCVKLTATRHSERKKYDAPHEVVMCPRSGAWVIVREVTVTQP
jgi:hypothetical protein